MSGSEPAAVGGSAVRQHGIAEHRDAEPGALLAASRQLISEAQAILAEVRKQEDGQPGSLAFGEWADPRVPPAKRGPSQRAHVAGRRLLAAVPAAAGIALLGVGVAALTGSNTRHALTLDVQGSPFPSTTTSAGPQNTDATGPVLEAPVSLSVPRLRSQALVAGEVHVQTAGPEAGLLDAPPDFRQLGWYRHGSSGALVFDGHVGYRNAPGPLALIGSLGVGDVVMVGFPSGDRAFSVSVVGRAVKGQLPQQYFSDRYDGDIMLITCDYTSPFRAGHFQDNVYLVAVPSR